MNNFLKLTTLLAGTTLAGCFNLISIIGSGNPVEKTYDFSDFTSLDISHGCTVVVQPSETYSVSVTIDDNLAQYLDVHQNGSTVSIGLQDMNAYSTSKFKAVIKCPELTGCMGSGGSRISAEQFMTNKNVSLSLSGGSSFNGNWSCGNLSAMFSGGSTADLAGDCKNLTIDFSGGSVGHMEDLTSDDAHVMLSGGSIAYIHSSGTVNGDLSGGSKLKYSGNPSIGKINTSGGSTYSRN